MIFCNNLNCVSGQVYKECVGGYLLPPARRRHPFHLFARSSSYHFIAAFYLKSYKLRWVSYNVFSKLFIQYPVYKLTRLQWGRLHPTSIYFQLFIQNAVYKLTSVQWGYLSPRYDFNLLSDIPFTSLTSCDDALVMFSSLLKLKI